MLGELVAQRNGADLGGRHQPAASVQEGAGKQLPGSRWSEGDGLVNLVIVVDLAKTQRQPLRGNAAPRPPT